MVGVNLQGPHKKCQRTLVKLLSRSQRLRLGIVDEDVGVRTLGQYIYARS